MAEVTENGHQRWDAGAGTTALGIIGTALGGLATALVGGNTLAANSSSTPFENQQVCQHDIELVQQLNDANAKIQKYESERYSDQNDLKIYEYFIKKVDDLKDSVNTKFAAQEVINANLSSAVNVLNDQVKSSANLLSSITKTAVPQSVICNFDSTCSGCQTTTR